MVDFFSILSGLYVLRMMAGHGHQYEAGIILILATVIGIWEINKKGDNNGE